MIQIYTGDGKGKTTASLGLALRAVGHGFKVLMIQFMKGKINYGELLAVKKIKGLRIEQYGRPDFVNPENPDPIDIKFAKDAFDRARQAVKDHEFDIIILDEINVAVSYGLIEATQIIALMKTLPEKTELILTGREMPEVFRQYADLISEVREIKHYFKKGVKARKGFEY